MKLLAQASLESVPDTFWKQFCMALIVLILVVAAIVGIWVALRKKEPVRLNDEPPIEVRKSPKRFNHELAEQRHGEVTRRLEDHDQEISSLWTAVRVDIPAMERRLNDAGEKRSGDIHDRINEILSAVSELRGEVKGKR